MSFMTVDEIRAMGFRSVGKNCLLSKKASYYNCQKISIGDNVRIDDFCVLSAGESGIEIGSYVHIAIFSALIGKAKIVLSDFSAISGRVIVYSSSDDYSGNALVNPTIDSKFLNVDSRDVFIAKHVVVGAGSILLPGVTVGEGVAIGAQSLVNKSCEAFGIYAGVPIRRIKERSKKLLDLEKEFISK